MVNEIPAAEIWPTPSLIRAARGLVGIDQAAGTPQRPPRTSPEPHTLSLRDVLLRSFLRTAAFVAVVRSCYTTVGVCRGQHVVSVSPCPSMRGTMGPRNPRRLLMVADAAVAGTARPGRCRLGRG